MKYLILTIVSLLLSNCIIQPMPEEESMLSGKFCSDERPVCYEFKGNNVAYGDRFEYYKITEHYVINGQNKSEGGVLKISGSLFPVDYTVDNTAFRTHVADKTFTYYRQ